MKYNETTKIGDTEIKLTEKEQQNVASFHKSRIAFAILGDGTIAINNKDEREHKVYLKEDFGISEEEMETLIRGYIKPGRIVFYRSLCFYPIDEDPMKYIVDLAVPAVQHFGQGNYSIWNGLIIGYIGEEWEPLLTPYQVHLSLKFSRANHRVYVRKI